MYYRLIENLEEATILARDLHELLGIGTAFRMWFPIMCEYGFIDGVDYTLNIFVHPQNKQEVEDYNLTIDMAKQICMLQRSEKVCSVESILLT